MCEGKQHGTVSESLENLRQPLPLRVKARLFARNNWHKLKTRSDCCGNHGEPGC